MKTIEQILAERMKHYRRLWGYTQADLAEQCGKSLSAIAQIETGVIWPAPDTLRAIAKAFGIAEFMLFEDPRADELKAPAPAQDSNLLRRFLAVAATLDDSQVSRYLAMMEAELSAASGVSQLPTKPRKQAE